MFNCADVTVSFVVTLLSNNLSPKDRALVSEPAGETMKASFLSNHNATISVHVVGHAAKENSHQNVKCQKCKRSDIWFLNSVPSASEWLFFSKQLRFVKKSKLVSLHQQLNLYRLQHIIKETNFLQSLISNLTSLSSNISFDNFISF